MYRSELIAYLLPQAYYTHILKQKSLATQNLVGILFMIKNPVLKIDKNVLLKFVYMLTIRS